MDKAREKCVLQRTNGDDLGKLIFLQFWTEEEILDAETCVLARIDFRNSEDKATTDDN